MDSRAAWSAAWAAVSAVTWGAALSVWVANSDPDTTVPLWPAFIFAALGAVSLYLVFAPLLKRWPWNPQAVRRRAAKSVLPALRDLHRQGHPLTRPPDKESSDVYARNCRAWSTAVSFALEEHHPAMAAEFGAVTNAETFLRVSEQHTLLGRFIEDLDSLP